MALNTLPTLVRAGLIREAAGVAEADYTIHHSLIQEVAYRSLLREQRRQLHLTVGEVLERAFSGKREKVASELAEHFSQAEAHPRAFRYHLLAGDEALRLYAHAEALSHYDRALAAADRAGVDEEHWGAYLRRGRAFELSGKHDRALENYGEMESKARQARREDQELRARLQTAVLYCTPSPVADPAKGLEIARQTLQRAQELGDIEAEARSQWLHLLVFQFTLDRLDDATQAGERALELTQGDEMPELRGFILNDLGAAYGIMGRVQRAGEVLDEARALMDDLDNIPMLTNVLANQMIQRTSAGEFEQALALSEEGYKISEKIGNLWGQACSLMYIDLVHAELGDYKRALETGAQCIRIGGAAGFAVPSVVSNATQAWIKTQLGLLEEASAHVAEEDVETTGLLSTIAGISLAALAIARTTGGDLAGAARALSKAAETIPPDPDSVLHPAVLFTRFARAKLHVAREQPRPAIELADEMVAEMQHHGFGLLRSDFLLVHGLALLLSERHEPALEIIEEGVEYAESIQSVRALWQLLAAEAEVHDEQGRPDLAAERRSRARSMVDQIADSVAPLGLDTPFLTQPSVRQLIDAT